MYYVKRIGLIYVYIVMTVMTGTVISTITNYTTQFILSLLNLLLFTSANVMVFLKFGEDDMKTLFENDVIRQKIIETGKDLSYDKKSEYKPYKGFLFGLYGVIPMIIVYTIHLILELTNGVAGAGYVGNMMYLVFYHPVSSLSYIISGGISWQYYFITLYGVPYLMILNGVMYILGGKQAKKQQSEIMEKKQKIYGDNK